MNVWTLITLSHYKTHHKVTIMMHNNSSSDLPDFKFGPSGFDIRVVYNFRSLIICTWRKNKICKKIL